MFVVTVALSDDRRCPRGSLSGSLRRFAGWFPGGEGRTKGGYLPLCSCLPACLYLCLPVSLPIRMSPFCIQGTYTMGKGELSWSICRLSLPHSRRLAACVGELELSSVGWPTPKCSMPKRAECRPSGLEPLQRSCVLVFWP